MDDHHGNFEQTGWHQIRPEDLERIRARRPAGPRRASQAPRTYAGWRVFGYLVINAALIGVTVWLYATQIIPRWSSSAVPELPSVVDKVHSAPNVVAPRGAPTLRETTVSYTPRAAAALGYRCAGGFAYVLGHDRDAKVITPVRIDGRLVTCLNGRRTDDPPLDALTR